jgi:hypothetical protein
VLDALFDKAVSDRFSFDRFNEETQRWLRYQQDELIQGLEEDIRDTIEMVVMRGVREGLDAEQIADDIRDVMTLTDTQAQAVLNYRSMLEELDPEALSRQLRNGDYDEALMDAIESGTPLDEAMIDEMTTEYADNYLDYRAATIAETESVRMANEGLQDAYEQAIARGALPDDAVRQFWQLDLDEKTCDICLSIIDNQPDEGIGMDDTWDSDDGAIDSPPVHPNCRCSVEVVTDLDKVPDEEE